MILKPENKSAMKSRLYISPLVVAVIAVLLSACSATTSNDKNKRLTELKAQQTNIAAEIKKLEEEIVKENPSAAPVRMTEVAVVELAQGPFDYFIKTQGSVEAVDNIVISARTPGIISQVYVKEGDVVRKGQILAQIDDSIIKQNIEELKLSLEHANTVYDRQKNLWDKKIGTEVQYLQAKNTRDGLERRLSAMNEQLDMSRIKTPIAGSVDEVTLKIGENAAPGVPAFRVVSNDKLKLKADVSEAYVTSVKKGSKAILIFPELDKTIEARVTFVGRTINELSRTFPVEIALTSNKQDLRPNMTGVLKVIFRTVPNAISVPINIVQELNGEKVVYVAEMQGKNLVAKRKVIQIGGVYGNHAEVTSGLNAGDKLITVGFQGLDDGELVKL